MSGHRGKSKALRNEVEDRLLRLGYAESRRNEWVKNDRTVHVMHSSEFSRCMRIKWREAWKVDSAVVFDYSPAGGPVFVVPLSKLFASRFVSEKRRKDSYVNSSLWWSQRFPMDHELARVVLGFKDNWNLL
jgi:hypothetical protein